jgi:hypothetical protein
MWTEGGLKVDSMWIPGGVINTGEEGAGKRGGWGKRRGNEWGRAPGPKRAAGRGKYVGEKQEGGGYSPMPLGPPTALPTIHHR